MNDFSFRQDGQLIRNPFFSACGRLPVDPVECYGFERVNTGGGCVALHRDLGNGTYLVLTDSSGSYEPDLADWRDALVGLYRTATGDEIECVFARELLREIKSA